MTDEQIIEAMARAMFKDDQINRLDIAKAALAVCRPIIEAPLLERLDAFEMDGASCANEVKRLRAENEKLRAALINLWAAAYDLPRTKECRLYNALRDADEVLKEA